MKLGLIALVLVVAGSRDSNVDRGNGAMSVRARSFEIEWGEYRIKKPDDTYWELFGKNWKIVAKINGIEPKLLRTGQKIKIPKAWLDGENLREEMDFRLLENYSPMPKTKEDLKKYPKCILVNISNRYFGAYEKGELKRWGPITSGRYEHPTPRGGFSIKQKVRWTRSEKYMGRDGKGIPMPFAQRFYNGYWFHQGNMPERSSSHGCIRLFEEDAKWLFDWTEIGTDVIIQ